MELIKILLSCSWRCSKKILPRGPRLKKSFIATSSKVTHQSIWLPCHWFWTSKSYSTNLVLGSLIWQNSIWRITWKPWQVLTCHWKLNLYQGHLMSVDQFLERTCSKIDLKTSWTKIKHNPRNLKVQKSQWRVPSRRQIRIPHRHKLVKHRSMRGADSLSYRNLRLLLTIKVVRRLK